MKLSNRVLGVLIIFGFILSFYGFYKYFYELNLIDIELNSNVSNFSGSISNSKFSKDFSCKEKLCSLEGIPPFEYDIIVYKDNYKNYKSSIKSNKTSINITLEKDIQIEEIEIKKISREELINNIKNKNIKIDFSGKRIIGNKIIGNTDFVYFLENDKLYFYNLKNNNSYSLEFIPNIKYIKLYTENNFIIVTDIGSFNYDLLNQKIEYFSLFSDFISLENSYIGVVNTNDIIRKNNFGFDKNTGNLLVSYDFNNKNFSILEEFVYNINKLYLDDNIIYIENNVGNKFKVIGY